MILGKGFYVWRAEKVLERMGTTDVTEAVRRAVAANVQHVIVKIADGERPFPDPAGDGDGRKETITGHLIDALRNAGITVWGWAFAYGQGADPDRQAAVFAARARHFSLTGMVIDAEDYDNRTWRTQAGAQRAGHYVRRLRDEMAGVNGLLVGLSSYRYIRYHQNFPFAAFMEGCDLAMPQVYWVARSGGDAVHNLLVSYEDYMQYFPHKLFIPTGAAYGEQTTSGDESYYWSSSPSQIRRFLDQVHAMRFSAATFWSWEHALNDPGNQSFSGSQLWDAVAEHPFTTETLHSSADEAESIEINVGGEGYADGVYAGQPHASFEPFVWQNRSLKYAQTVANTPTSAWAFWQPDIQEPGVYEIAVWVPGNHATTRSARYSIQGAVGESGPVTVVVNQNRFFNEWVALGRFELDGHNPLSGHVSLTNATGEGDRRICFSPIRWRRQQTQIVVQGPRLADGFDAPIGTDEERRSSRIWPGDWVDVNPYGTSYDLRPGVKAYHTGADLNLNIPQWDSDRDAPVYAIASGEVTSASNLTTWGNVLVIRHDPIYIGGPQVYARYAHLGAFSVGAGKRVERGQIVGRVGQDASGGPFHLHFDISPTEVLLAKSGDWPGADLGRLSRDYVDPKEFIRQHRPPPDAVVAMEGTRSLQISTQFVQRSGTRFVHNGQTFQRFIGINLQGLVHYGDIQEMVLSQPGHRLQQLQAARNMGARVVRVFLANRKRAPVVVVERLRQVLKLIEQHNLDLYVIPALTNFYHNWGQFVQGDDEFYQNHNNMTLLAPLFFQEGFRRNYLPYVEQIVSALRDEPRILAWEIGNEMKAEQDPHSFVRFNQTVAARIKALDPNHMVTTGMKSTQHAWMEHEPTLRRELYGTDTIDFITVHSYENGPAADDDGDSAVYQDADLARELGKPLVVEEAGIFKTMHGHAVDRGAELDRHMARWLDELGAYGYMQWGFDSLPVGDGDRDVGMVRGDHDWDDLYRRYQVRAQKLAHL